MDAIDKEIEKQLKAGPRTPQLTILPFYRMPVGVRLKILSGILLSFIGIEMTVAIVRGTFEGEK